MDLLLLLLLDVLPAPCRLKEVVLGSCPAVPLFQHLVK
jgi:hypothetical protein